MTVTNIVAAVLLALLVHDAAGKGFTNKDNNMYCSFKNTFLNYKSTTQDCKSPQEIHNYCEPSQIKPTILFKTENSRCDLGGERLNIILLLAKVLPYILLLLKLKNCYFAKFA